VAATALSLEFLLQLLLMLWLLSLLLLLSQQLLSQLLLSQLLGLLLLLWHLPLLLLLLLQLLLMLQLQSLVMFLLLQMLHLGVHPSKTEQSVALVYERVLAMRVHCSWHEKFGQCHPTYILNQTLQSYVSSPCM